MTRCESQGALCHQERPGGYRGHLAGWACLFVLVGLLGACSSKTIRPQPAPLASHVPELPLRLAWSQQIRVAQKGGVSTPSNMVAAFVTGPDGAIYAVDDNGILALDRQGHTRWRARIVLADGRPARVADGLAASSDMLIVATIDGEIMALAQDDGRLLWRQPLPGEVLAPPVIARDRVFVHTGNGQLIGLDRSSGKRIWVYSEVLPSLTLRGTSAPVVVGDKVVAGFANGRLVAIDSASGSLVWELEVGSTEGRTVLARMTDIDADPVVIDGIVYASAYQRRLVAASLVTGRLLWSRDISTFLDMAHDEDRIYLIGQEGLIEAIDRHSGEIIWRQEALKHRRLSPPLVLAGRLLVADAAGYLHALAPHDGGLIGRYRYDTAQEVAAALQPYDKGILLRESSGRMIHLKWRADGEESR